MQQPQIKSNHLVLSEVLFQENKENKAQDNEERKMMHNNKLLLTLEENHEERAYVAVLPWLNPFVYWYNEICLNQNHEAVK